MDKVKKAGGDLLNGRWGEKGVGLEEPLTPPVEQEIQMTNPDSTRLFTLEEFQGETSQEKPLFVVDGHVYDGTAYLQDHPGGAQSILTSAGSDVTEDFMAIRKDNNFPSLTNPTDAGCR